MPLISRCYDDRRGQPARRHLRLGRGAFRGKQRPAGRLLRPGRYHSALAGCAGAPARAQGDLGREDDTVDPLLRSDMAEDRQIFEDFGLDYLTPLIERGLVS